MQQESQNKATGNIVDLHPLRIHVNPDSSEMLIEYSPDFSINWIALIGLAFLSAFLFLVKDAEGLMTLIMLELIFGGMLAYSVFAKRKICCSINKTIGNIHHFRGGILNTKFDESESNNKLADVTSLRMKRYIRRYGDTFQVLLSIQKWEKIELTGSGLNFLECQTYAEKIRNFIDPTLPIKAED